ncbi:C4-dicarboxylate TRAP transporter substrate-binding protein [Marinomonas mediterranea]|uniref:Extracellular solute-binding protein, family 7 n=1 Tax=Marinomonas mediterranea (strain ATCC 700492 / JCM 21426 / NBRC 103028 / MMB-1) TaxID=717774 RepID=F2JZQ5_MARM1|nr:C4-dicarboxylate TRAP transporter substrate-binding protein [Marinomonas mediterranea]ADZ90909.1 Extracellular solute-binding protein, family 7 [Marinomonas mediterranea MMB-1]WCN08953.1 C4-dicarboxylate ABC transporter substrate-binding protein [Marinomonas mediterranea]WCN12985.1 C4-dicarboxylate ABC transporter substrate-binding protein [Marinomonas mediterranea]WCN17054.1 C4-dicarboxylate ABC transporter substrate-binding protein [Marinomonas mediterranea MMB-1]
MNRKLFLNACMITFTYLALQSTAVSAKTIRAVSGFGPSHVLATTAYPIMAEKLKDFTDGRWKIRDTPSGLLSVSEMNQGLKRGVAEMGTIIMPYFAADFTNSALVAELSVVGTDNRAIASAVSEYISTCSECIAEFSTNGQVYTGSDATVTYELLTREPVRTSSDLAGMRIRTAGSVFTRFISEMGAEATQIPSTELFEMLSSGVLDGTYSSTPDLKNQRLYESVRYVTNIHQGVFNASAMPSLSNRIWSKMNEKDRHALMHAAQYAQAASIAGWRDILKEATAEGEKQGITFIEPDASLLAKAAEFRQKHIATVADTLEKRGVVNAQEKVDRYLALVEKWNHLVEGVDSIEELAELRYKEIWSHRKLMDYAN